MSLFQSSTLHFGSSACRKVAFAGGTHFGSVLSAHISDLHVGPGILYRDLSLPISRRRRYRLRGDDGECSCTIDRFPRNGTGNCCYFAQAWTGEPRLGWPDIKCRAAQDPLLSIGRQGKFPKRFEISPNFRNAGTGPVRPKQRLVGDLV